MIILYGTYSLFPRRIAFRNDYCLRCNQPRRAFAFRTFDLLHVFWIPLLPLGLIRRWRCSVCGQNPHEVVKTRRSYKIAGLVVLLFMTLAFWATPPPPGDEILFWFLRLGAPLGAVATAIHLFKAPADPTLKQHLARIGAATDMICPNCHTALANTPTWHCPRCGLKRM